MRIAPTLTLSPEQRETLEQWSRSRSLPARVVERARLVLSIAEGQQDKEVAAVLKITPKKVARWRKRFLTLGAAGLQQDAPRPGRNPENHPGADPSRGAHDHAAEAGPGHALEHPHDGGGGRNQ